MSKIACMWGRDEVAWWFRSLLATLFAFMQQNKSEEVASLETNQYLIESFTFGNLEVLSEDDDNAALSRSAVQYGYTNIIDFLN